MTILQVEKLSYATRSGVPLVKDVSFALQQGEIIGLVGGNGAGKSTLLKMLAGILVPSYGRAFLQQQPLQTMAPRERAQRLAYIAQHVASAWPLTVSSTVALGRVPHGVSVHALSAADRYAVDVAMRDCRIDYLKDRIVNTLSGGEQARVWLARALATQPSLLIADEPTAGLDLHYQLLFMELLRQWRTRDRAAIVAIHDLSLAARFCDRLLVLAHGRVAGFDTPAALMEQNILSEAFGVKLHALSLDGVPIITASARIDRGCV